MELNSKIFVAGHKGLVGSAICRKLKDDGYKNIIYQDRYKLDLRDKLLVDNFFQENKPEYVILAAAVVGGIHANNSQPVRFLKDNLLIQTNVIDAAHRFSVKKLVFLGSNCVYPRECPQPMKEEFILTGMFEETNQWYATAKIAGVKLCQAYKREYGFNAIVLMPASLYGPNDNFDPENSHVLPALINKIHLAKLNNLENIELWGTGEPFREFLFVDDFADACLFLMKNYDDESIINVGVGDDINIKSLANLIKEIIGYEGKIIFDSTKPDGTPKKLLNVSKLNNLGWKYSTNLKKGIEQTYNWYLNNLANEKI